MPEKPFSVVKREDLTPVCPHCEAELTDGSHLLHATMAIRDRSGLKVERG